MRKEVFFIRINGDYLLDAGNEILYQIFKGSGLLYDSKDVAHVTTTKATSVAGVWHLFNPVLPDRW